jgi:hypothetical protein
MIVQNVGNFVRKSGKNVYFGEYWAILAVVQNCTQRRKNSAK